MKQLLRSMLLMLLTLISAHSYAQLQGQAKIDSMLKELPRQKEDTNKVKLLFNLSVLYDGINADTGIIYGQQGLDLATKLVWEQGKAFSYFGIGGNCASKSDYTIALECYFKALKIFQAGGEKTGMATVCISVANVYFEQANYPKALDFFLRH